MRNEELQDLYPFENYAELDRLRRMKWCNGAIVYATDYYRKTAGENITYDGLIDAIKNMNMKAITALIYGAVRAADPDIDYNRFCDIYNNDHLMDNITAVLKGIAAYLPEPDDEVDHGENLDESYPDTQAEVKKKETEPTGDGGAGSQNRNAGSRLLNFLKSLYDP